MVAAAQVVAILAAGSTSGESLRSLPAQREAGGGDLEWVAEHFGTVEDAVVVGEHLYAAIGSRLEVFDADLESTAAPVATHLFVDGWPLALAATEDERLVVLAQTLDSWFEVRVFDVSQSPSPRLLDRGPVDRLRSSSGPKFVQTGEGRAWIATRRDVVAFNLDGPEGLYELGHWTVPEEESYYPGEIQALNRIDGVLLVAVYEQERESVGRWPTPHRQQVWAFDTRADRPLKPFGAPITLEDEGSRVAIGDRWMVTSSPASDEVKLWRMTEPGHLVRTGALSSRWLEQAGIQSPHQHHLLSTGDTLWMAAEETVHLIDLGRKTPVVLDRAKIPSLRPLSSLMVRFAAKLHPAAQRGVILREHGLHRVSFVAPRELGPARTADLATGEVTHVAADRRGAWARVDHRTEGGLWRVRGNAPPDLVEAHVSSILDADGERLFVAMPQEIRVLSEAEDGSRITTVVDTAGNGAFEHVSAIVAGSPSDGLLVRQLSDWQHVGLEGDRVVSRTPLPFMEDAILAGDIPWDHRRDSTGSVLVAAMDPSGGPGWRWPGLGSSTPFDAVAGRNRTIVVAHRAQRDVQLSVLGWAADLQPHILGALEMSTPFSSLDLGFEASAALADGVAWLVFGWDHKGNGQLIVAVDVSAPSFPKELGRIRLPADDLRANGFPLAAGGDHAWVVDRATGALQELRLHRAATPPVGPTRPPPTARPATSTPVATATATATDVPSRNVGAVYLPWASRP